MMDKLQLSDLQIIKRLLSVARPYWGKLTISYLVSLLRIPLVLLSPVPTMVAVDSVISEKPLPEWLSAVTPDIFEQSSAALLLLVVFLIVFFAFLIQVQNHGTILYKTYLGEKLTLDYRAQILRHAHQLSLAYHDEKGTSDSIYRVQNDASSIQGVLVYGLTPIVTASFMLISLIFVTAKMDFQLAMISISIAPVFVLLTNYFRKKLRSQWKKVKEAETSVLQVVQESLGTLRVVKAFGQEDREHGRFVMQSSKSLWARFYATIGQSTYSFSSAIIMAIGTAVVLFVGVGHVKSGILTIGELLVVLTYVSRIYAPLETIGQQVASLQQGLAGAQRTFTLLDNVKEVPEKENALSLTKAKGVIDFKTVCFSYDSGNPVLENIELHVDSGMKVGISGKTGAGKTTLISLLMRFYDPQSGAIYLDGIDIRDYKIKDLRNQFSIVLQEPVLLSATISENISYARPGASQSDIIEASIAANAHDFILKLPEAYDTQVGERGMRLSGGQRQRISIARAFLKRTPILILDEPTSSVDVATEAAIIEAMHRLMKSRTTFMISHRPSTLKHCDISIRLEAGKLIICDNQNLIAV